jgi:hypothetical protein
MVEGDLSGFGSRLRLGQLQAPRLCFFRVRRKSDRFGF